MAALLRVAPSTGNLLAFMASDVHQPSSYTLASKDYIHRFFLFRNEFPENLHFSYKKILFGNQFPENYISRIHL